MLSTYDYMRLSEGFRVLSKASDLLPQDKGVTESWDMVTELLLDYGDKED